MTKEYNWRIADWTDPEDYSVDEAVEDCNKIKEVPASPTEDYEEDKLEDLVAKLNDGPFKRECRKGTKLFKYICALPKFRELGKKELN